jgi:hypothetical protein
LIKVLRNILGQWKGAFVSYPFRCTRLIFCLLYPIPYCSSRYKIRLTKVLDGIIHFLFLIGDLLFLPEIYSSITCLQNPSVRPLSSHEVKVVSDIYGDNIQLQLVLLNSKASLFTKGKNIAYVAFQTINFWKTIEEAILVHECFHILQFQRLGSVYIYESLKAQHSKEGYDYGGVSFLEQGMLLGKRLEDFNFEQQAEIIEDAYRIKAQGEVLPVAYQYFIHQLDRYMKN